MIMLILMCLLDLNLRIWIFILELVIKLQSMGNSTKMLDDNASIKSYSEGEIGNEKLETKWNFNS